MRKLIRIMFPVLALLFLTSAVDAQRVDKLSRWDLMTQQREVLGFEDCIEVCQVGAHAALGAAMEEGMSFVLRFAGVDNDQADLLGRFFSLGGAFLLEGNAFLNAEDYRDDDGEVLVTAGAIRTDAALDFVERQLYAIQDLAYERWGWAGRIGVGVAFGALYVRTLPSRDLRP